MNCHLINKNDLNNSNNFENISFTSSAASFNEFFKKNEEKEKTSRSLENLNNETYILDNKNNIEDSLNKRSVLKLNNNDKDTKYEANISNHELLIQKLIECEGVGNDITKQLSALKDFLKFHYNVSLKYI